MLLAIPLFGQAWSFTPEKIKPELFVYGSYKISDFSSTYVSGSDTFPANTGAAATTNRTYGMFPAGTAGHPGKVMRTLASGTTFGGWETLVAPGGAILPVVGKPGSSGTVTLSFWYRTNSAYCKVQKRDYANTYVSDVVSQLPVNADVAVNYTTTVTYTNGLYLRFLNYPTVAPGDFFELSAISVK